MNLIIKLLFIALVLTSVSALAENRTIVIYVGGCSDADQEADVIYAADQNFNVLKKLNVSIVVEEKMKRCGYSFKKDSMGKQLDSGLTDIELHEELTKFFGQPTQSSGSE